MEHSNIYTYNTYIYSYKNLNKNSYFYSCKACYLNLFKIISFIFDF